MLLSPVRLRQLAAILCLSTGGLLCSLPLRAETTTSETTTPAATSTEAASVNADDIQERLHQTDLMRSRFENGEVLSRIELFRNGASVETNEYRVQFNDQGESRVEMLDTRARGQKVLLLPDAMWLYVPNTGKSIRITPMQRLMGQASYGDIASLSWHREYRWNGAVPQTETLDGRQALRLELDADRKSSTYRHLVVWLDVSSNQPLQAEFYLASGKLMKRASYQLTADSKGQPFVGRTRLDAPDRPDEYTDMTSSEPMATQHPSSLFTRQGFVQ